MSLTSQKTIERLILYRLLLEQLEMQGTANVYSNQLAELSGNTSAQVRRDLMTVGYLGNPRHGYKISELLKGIRALLEPQQGIAMVVIGIGNLGRAILGYFYPLKPKFNLVAAFDNDEHKINRVISGCRTYPVHEISTVLSGTTIDLGIITVPADQAQAAANVLIRAGIKGLVNFSPAPVKVPEDVFIENMHMTMTFEKVVYFSRLARTGGTQ
jgi:redox-sensing transcriptional repressor